MLAEVLLAKYMSARSLVIVKKGKGVTVTTGFATSDATPSWTTQRAAYNYWVNCRFSPWSPPWIPTVDIGRLLPTFYQSLYFKDKALHLDSILSGEI